MTFKINIGGSDFEKLRKKGSYYVDKTNFIYELINNKDNEVSLFTRPRRFGKTLMLSMMENFFSIRKDSRSIFEGLSITQYNEFCKEWMNQYPVIFVSFKDVDSLNYDTAYDKLKATIADICKDYENVLENKNINQGDLNIFKRLMLNEASDAEIQGSLKTLTRILSVVYGRKVILLIDEYDVPIAKACKNNYYNKMLDTIKGILSASLKGNDFLQFAVVTGCLRIVKESIFTGVNNFAVYTILNDEFSSYFGFSSEEVKSMLIATDVVDKASIIKEWYDGYLFGNSYLYCPWDVVSYLSALKDDKDAEPLNYWENTSSNEIILDFAKRYNADISEDFEDLLNGKTIQKTISETLTYDLVHSSVDNLWSILLMTGYLTKAKTNQSGENLELKIPNKEVASIFKDSVLSLFKETIEANTSKQKKLLEALWNGNESDATKLISEFLLDTISYYDYREDYYHAFLSGLIVGSGYKVKSNQEVGLGRPDIQLLDRRNSRSLILEIKRSRRKEDLDLDCNKAIEQIIEKGYDKKTDEYDTVLCYGISFFKKQAMVKLASKINKKE